MNFVDLGLNRTNLIMFVSDSIPEKSGYRHKTRLSGATVHQFTDVFKNICEISRPELFFFNST